MSDLISFLRARNIEESLLMKLEADKIDCHVLVLMDDQQLANYLPCYGDRLAAVAFCKLTDNTNQEKETQATERPWTVLERMRGTLKRRSVKQSYKDSKCCSKKNAERTTRRVELGWLHFDKRTLSYKQVRIQNGGGVRHLQLDKDLGASHILDVGKSLFFPDGTSSKGALDKFEFCVKDFALSNMDSFTVADLYSRTKVRMLRLYICTKDLQTIDAAQKETCTRAIDQTSPSSNQSDDMVTKVDTDSDGDLAANLQTAPVAADVPDTGSTQACAPGSGVSRDNAFVDMSDTDELPDLDSGTPTIQFQHSVDRRNRLTLERHRESGIEGEASQVLRPRADENVSETVISSEDETSAGDTEDVSESILVELAVLGSRIETHRNLVNVDRDDVLDGAFRAFSRQTFKLWGSLDVKFVAEDGIDEGGPMREFMRLAVAAVQKLPIFEGPLNQRMLALDYNSLQKKRYLFAGKILAYCIVHRGPLPAFFSPLFYTILSEGEERAVPCVNDILDAGVQLLVKRIQESSSPTEFRNAVSDAEEIISLAGCLNMTITFCQETQTNLVTSLCRFLVIDRLRNAIKQFAEGLDSMGLLGRIKQNNVVWRDAFVHCQTDLDAQQMVALFDTQWSGDGSNRLRQERRITTYWRDLLQDLEDGVTGPLTGRRLGLKDVLVFVTGADTVPPLGFDPSPTISFIQPGDVEQDHFKGMPLVNTCAMHLRLPLVDSFEEFKSNMTSAMDVVTTFTSQ